MKLINRRNFISTVCVSFTIVVCCKLIIEKLNGVTDRYYTENIFACLGFSVIITAVLALQFYLQKFPLIPVLIGQYAVVAGAAAGIVKLSDSISDTGSDAMAEMIISVTIPFVVGALVYYIKFFRQLKKANRIIVEIGDPK